MSIRVNIAFVSARNEWVAILRRGELILDLGCEATEAEAREWSRRALAACNISDGPHRIPDMYDRATRQ
jgi:hypothetical protein